MTYRAAMIGCGLIGWELTEKVSPLGIYTHAAAYDACPRTRLVAVCDADLSKAQRCAARWQVPACFDDAARMLEQERPEIVSVCTPNATHYAMVRLALLSPGIRAVLAEKPLALELRQAEELAGLARERNVILAVNYTRRFAGSHQAVQQYLASGLLGKLQAITGTYTKGAAHNGSHWFDLLCFLAGDVVRVWAEDRLHEDSDDPTLSATLELASGLKAHLAGCSARAFATFEMDLIGTEGRIRLLDGGNTIEWYHVAQDVPYPGFRSLVLRQRQVNALRDVFVDAVSDVARCLDEGGTPRCTAGDAIRALRIALAVRTAAKNRCAVELGDG